MILICKYCGKKFNSEYSKKKFCSKLCYTKWQKGKSAYPNLVDKRGIKPKNRKTSICQVCDNKFEHWSGRDAKYCSKICWSKRNPQILFYCLNCGKEFWDYKVNREKNVFCSKSCANSFNQRGHKSHFWKGGKTPISKLLRSRTEYLNWRTEVFIRDDYTCQDCGIKSGNGKKIYLNAHHIKEVSKYPKLIYDVSNGITLCKNCHLLKHFHKF